MKALYPEKGLYYLAEEANANYPASFTQNMFPQKVWKATSHDSWFRLHCDAGAGGLCLSTTNAAIVSVTIKQIIYGTATSAISSLIVLRCFRQAVFLSVILFGT